MNDLDSYNIFALMGLNNISDDEKRRLLLDMNEVVWSEFLLTRLDKILTAEQLQEVQRKVEQKQDTEEIIKFIQSKVPSFEQLLLEYSRSAKVGIIKKHYDDVIEDTKQAIPVSQPDGVQNKLSEKLEKYTKAKKLLENSQWPELNSLMTS